jgi:septum formation protein
MTYRNGKPVKIKFFLRHSHLQWPKNCLGSAKTEILDEKSIQTHTLMQYLLEYEGSFFWLKDFMRLILGSQSPRRKEILSFFAVPFVQIPSAFDEESVLFQGDPIRYAQDLALKKSDELAQRFSDDVILTADTVVYFEGNIYNKPKDEKGAHEMLRKLSGNWHQVFTAVTVRKQGIAFSGIEETKILFHPLTEQQIDLYHQSCSYLDKAGAYAIQQAGSILVARIEGCYYNVMGLPINILKELLLKTGIDLWKYLRDTLN